jgi:hypothetical protein
MICNIPIGPYEKGPYKINEIEPFYYNFDYLDLKVNKRLPRKLKKKLKKLYDL